MPAINMSKKVMTLGLSTAMAAVLLSGCASQTGARANVAASASGNSLNQHREQAAAITLAENAVLAQPNNSSLRMALGDSYLDAGRFASAETAFDNAMMLGETSARAALSLALTKIAQAKYAEAAALLNDWDREIAKADLGLALALAGQPERGVHIMSNAIRGGENTMKMRQNLAYAYAMAGRWREARLMAQQDLSAADVNTRLEQWASMSSSEAYQRRVAGLLQVPHGIRDDGQPAQLALGNSQASQHLAMNSTVMAQPLAAPIGELEPVAELTPATAPAAMPAAAIAPAAFAAPAEMPSSTTQSMQNIAQTLELPAIAPIEIAPSSALAAQTGSDTPSARIAPSEEFVTAFQSETPASPALAASAPETIRFVSNPVIQQFGSQANAAQTAQVAQPRIAPQTTMAQNTAAAPSSLAIASPTPDTHLVQLGSFASEAGAKRAWDIYVSRFPELAQSDMVITQAVVRGKRFWRVSAGGFDQSSSRAMCGRVRSGSADGCISWAAARPLPGAVETDVRLARR